MKKLLEQNLAVVIVLIVFAIVFSSCGIQFGDYERYQEVNRKCWVADDGTKHTGQVEDYYNERDYEFTSAIGGCENCDEID